MTFLGSCKKNASLVGSWNQTSERDVEKTAGVLIYDTTYSVSGANSDVITFRSDGTCTEYFQGGTDVANYSYSGGRITFVESGRAYYENVTTLNDHTLTLQYIDTTNYNPVTVDISYYTYSR